MNSRNKGEIMFVWKKKVLTTILIISFSLLWVAGIVSADTEKAKEKIGRAHV